MNRSRASRQWRWTFAAGVVGLAVVSTGCAGTDGEWGTGAAGDSQTSNSSPQFTPGSMGPGVGGSTAGDGGSAAVGTSGSTTTGTTASGTSTGGASTGSDGSTGTGSTTTTTGDGGTTTGSTGMDSMSTAGGMSGATGTTGSTTGTTGSTTGTTGTTGDETGTTGGGECCSDGDCLCHGDVPQRLTSEPGPYDVEDFELNGTGTAFYPTNAELPLAAIALTGGFTNSGPEMLDWGPFYASWGIVCVITGTVATDLPGIRAAKMLSVIEELKSANQDSGGPLHQKLAGRYGVSGYSMGGGGTLQALGDNTELMTGVGLAAWTVGTVASGVESPTLLLCGGSDGVAPCSQSEAAYDQIPDSVPKMLVEIGGVSHLSWFGPKSAGGGVSGDYALAFQKVFLEGDERWKSLLLSGDGRTNIQ